MIHILFFVLIQYFQGDMATGSKSPYDNKAVFRIQVWDCGVKKNGCFLQTGFLVRKNGELGIITALHGVVGCENKKIMAERSMDDKQNYKHFSDLRVSKVDISRDIAFLTSATLASIKDPPLQMTYYSEVDQLLQVTGYPQGIPGQLSHPVGLQQTPKTALASILPSSIKMKLDQRGSPDPKVSVLSMSGVIQPGYSGAPILNQKQQVIGMADGGLAGGFAQINWAIPIMEIDLQPVEKYQNRLNELGLMDATALYESPQDDGGMAMESGGAVIMGKIRYNGSPASNYTGAFAVLSLMEVESRRDIPVRFRYNNQSGDYIIEGVPPGKFYPFILLEAGYPFYTESGGDFHGRISGMNADIIVAPHDKVIGRDLKVINSIHLKKPVDNQEVRKNISDPPDVFYAGNYYPSSSVFEWDPVPGASTYRITFLLERGDPNNIATAQRLDTKIYTVAEPRIYPNLTRTAAGQWYMFSVEAYNSKNELLGTYQNYYIDGSGGWLKFKVQ